MDFYNSIICNIFLKKAPQKKNQPIEIIIFVIAFFSDNIIFAKNNIMNRYFLLFIFVISLFACNHENKQQSDNAITINGKIANGEGKQIILQLLKFNEKQVVDSVILKKDGAFSFIQKPDEKSIYLLKKDDNHYITIIADKGEIISLATDYNFFDKKYSIEGSSDSKLLCELNNHLQSNRLKLDSIDSIWKEAIRLPNRTAIKQSLDSAYYKAAKDQYNFQYDFINKNSHSLSALIALYLPLGREALIKENTDFALFEKVSQDLIKLMPENSHAINFAKRIKQRKMLELEKKMTEKQQLKN